MKYQSPAELNFQFRIDPLLAGLTPSVANMYTYLPKMSMC